MQTGGPSGRGSSSSSRRLQDRFERAGKAGDRVLAARDPEGGMAEGRWGGQRGVKEPPVGFEPTTARLRIESSTTELRWRSPNLAAAVSTRYSLRLGPVTHLVVGAPHLPDSLVRALRTLYSEVGRWVSS